MIAVVKVFVRVSVAVLGFAVAPVLALDLSVGGIDVSIGGGDGGVSVSAGIGDTSVEATVGGGGGNVASGGVSVGGTGVNAGVTGNGGSLLNAETGGGTTSITANLGGLLGGDLGNLDDPELGDALAGIDLSQALLTPGAADSPAERIRRAFQRMPVRKQRQARLTCRAVLADPGAYNPNVLVLCKLVARI